MKCLNGYRKRWVLTGVIAVFVLSAVNAWGADFVDDFNRPDGEVGNGWLTETEEDVEIKIVDNEILIEGRQLHNWWKSGIYRPVEGQTKFSFDFKIDDNFQVGIGLADAGILDPWPYNNDIGFSVYTFPGGPLLYSYKYGCGACWSGWIEIPGSEKIEGEYNTLMVEQDGTEFTITLNGKVLGTFTNSHFTGVGQVFIGADARAGTVGSLHIDNVKIGKAPIFDFNGDGIVDSADMCIMIEHWGEEYSLCDIGPKPLGDGIVDVNDLIVLAEHLFEEVDDPTLIAHWPLDETEGMFTADSVGDGDAVLSGGIEWQPSSGQINGALKLNGVDSCAIASTTIDPADGPFSIFAWIKDGAPGQVIVSQQAVSNWLALDSEGNLMTELKSSDQLAAPLVSETVITDGQWHRIGLVWDGSSRILYVDGFKVAEDTQPGVESSANSLYIGVDKNYAAGTFFSGLIDDVRIYNRAVSP